MTRSTPTLTDDLIRQAVRSRAGTMPSGLVAEIVADIGTVEQRRRSLVPRLFPRGALRAMELLVAALIVAALAGTAWLVGARLATVQEPLTHAGFDAVFLRAPSDADPNGASTIVAVAADGSEQVIASLPGVATDVTAAPFAPRLALSEDGRLALLMRNGDRVAWAILDTGRPDAAPIPVDLPGRDAIDPGYAIWGPGGRLAIAFSRLREDQAIAFVDPASGRSTIHPISEPLTCFTNRCTAWTEDGSGIVVQRRDTVADLVVMAPDGTLTPLRSRVSPIGIGTRDVNAAGDLLLGGTNPMDDPGIAQDGLSVRARGDDNDRQILRLGTVELSDRAWAANGRDAWLLTAAWNAANRSVTLERFAPPETRTNVASFLAAVDLPAPDVYAPAASFAGIAPDDSLAVVDVVTSTATPIVFERRLVDLLTGVVVDVDGQFVGWLAHADESAGRAIR